LIALRAIMETPVAELSQEAVLQRQMILAAVRDYQPSIDAGFKARDKLVASTVLGSNAAETKALAPLYDAWEKSSVERQRLLAQRAVGRWQGAGDSPPFRTTAELQQALAADEALLEFHNMSGNIYGFMLTKTDAKIWQLPDARKLRAGLADFLKAIGNYGS